MEVLTIRQMSGSGVQKGLVLVWQMLFKILSEFTTIYNKEISQQENRKSPD